jgi:hypothetical protein
MGRRDSRVGSQPALDLFMVAVLAVRLFALAVPHATSHSAPRLPMSALCVANERFQRRTARR